VNVKCKICGVRLKIINPRHLKKHNISLEEYNKKFGEVKSSWNSGKQCTNFGNMVNLNHVAEDICKLYGNGKSPKEIVDDLELKCSIRPVIRIIEQKGLRRNTGKAASISAKKRRKPVDQYKHGPYLVTVKSGFLFKSSLNKNARLLLECEICNKEFERSYHCFKLSLLNHNRILCRKCGCHVNGEIKTSKQQRWIHDNFGGNINHLISNIFVDIALIENKIIIEYDGWYWHKNRRREDRRRDEFLKGRGWKIIRVRGRRKLPTIKSINKAIKTLKETNKKYCSITLSDWLGYED